MCRLGIALLALSILFSGALTQACGEKELTPGREYEVTLVSKASNGDVLPMYRYLKPVLRRLAISTYRTMRLSLQEAESELAQVFFLWAQEGGLRNWRPENGRLKVFVYVAIRNRLLSRFTSNSRRRLREERYAEMTQLGLEGDRSSELDYKFELRERAQRVEQAFAELEAKGRAEDVRLWRLFHLEEMSVNEISQEMGFKGSTVRVKLHRFRNLLRERLEASGR